VIDDGRRRFSSANLYTLCESMDQSTLGAAEDVEDHAEGELSSRERACPDAKIPPVLRSGFFLRARHTPNLIWHCGVGSQAHPRCRGAGGKGATERSGMSPADWQGAPSTIRGCWGTRAAEEPRVADIGLLHARHIQHHQAVPSIWRDRLQGRGAGGSRRPLTKNRLDEEP